MKKSLVAVLALVLATGAVARQGEFGLGLMLGDPTGVTGKYWLDEKSAVDAAAAWSLNDEDFNLHVDYLVHSFEKLKEEPAQWAFHYGIGARLRFPEDNNGNGNENDDATLGVRVPLGLDLYPSKLPLEFFIEVAPVMDLVPDTDFDMEFGLGARFYFR